MWGGGVLESKPHVVKWDIVCLDKRKSGLGVRCLHSLNKALLYKWIWRFAKERDALWREVICGKFGEFDGGWCFEEGRDNYGVGLWKAIRHFWESSLFQNFLLSGQWEKGQVLERQMVQG